MSGPTGGEVRGGLWKALLGGVGGAVLGFYLTVAIFVAKARVGLYVYSLHDITAVRWEMMPTAAGLIGGALLAWRDLPRFGSAVKWGVVAAVVAIPVGWLVGPSLWSGRSAAWAGASLAAGIGLAGGIAIGATTLSSSRRDAA